MIITLNLKACLLFLATYVFCTLISESAIAASDPRDDNSPWAIAPGAEAKVEYSKFNPMIGEAGIKWLRCFMPWNRLEPQQGQWTWEENDTILANTRANSMRTVGFLGFMAKWAAPGGNMRAVPPTDMKYWSEYTTQVVTRYQKEIKYWEVWNEFNGGFGISNNKPKDYADLTVAAYDAAKKIDPEAKIGISCANFDLSFFDKTIKAGAAGHFDYVCVHPYENLNHVANGGESGYLAMASNIRKMLADNKQNPDMPLWITEIGTVTDGSPEQDAFQAQQMVKSYVLSIAQGFEKIFWFEAMGPAVYGKQHNNAHGIIRPDGTPRPAFTALKTMTGLLGAEPKYAGWLSLTGGGYGFAFESPAGTVLAAWSPPKGGLKAKFPGDVTLVDLAGKKTPFASGQELALDRIPVFITGLPDALIKEAKENKDKPFPWGGDYTHTDVVRCQLGANLLEEGIQAGKPDILEVVIIDAENLSCRKMDSTKPGQLNHPFRVHPSFVASQPRKLEITVVAKRAAAGKNTDLRLTYETTGGYKPAPPAWVLPADDQWHENTWKVDDANFIAQWGYNIGFQVGGSGQCLVKEIRVKK